MIRNARMLLPENLPNSEFSEDSATSIDTTYDKTIASRHEVHTFLIR